MDDPRFDMKKIIGSGIDDSLDELLETDVDEKVYGSYAGKVVDNKDPENLGRCKIRVYGVFDNAIPDDDLPWAMPNFNFVGSTVGSYIVPPIDSIVKVEFDQGDIYLPQYSTKVVDRNNPLGKVKNLDFDGNPDVMIFFATDKGDFFKVDRKNKKMELRTSSGDFIEIDNSGDIEINTKSADGLLGGNITINAKGTVTINAPVVEVPNRTGAVVEPSVKGGPFNSMMFDPITGAPHQGTKVTNS